MSTSNILLTTARANQTDNDDNNWTVPSDFLPRYKGSITYQYAMNRKPWAPTFYQHQFTPLARHDHSDKTLENSWHQYMLKLYDEIQDMG